MKRTIFLHWITPLDHSPSFSSFFFFYIKVRERVWVIKECPHLSILDIRDAPDGNFIPRAQSATGFTFFLR